MSGAPRREEEEDGEMSSVPDSLFGNMPTPGIARNNNEDATSVAASLFGHLPLPATSAASVSSQHQHQQLHQPLPLTPTQQQQESYVDFYASLGSDRRPPTTTTSPSRTGGASSYQDDLETSLLSEDDVESSSSSRGVYAAQRGGRGGLRHNQQQQRLPVVRPTGFLADNRTLVNLLAITVAVLGTILILYWMVESSEEHGGGGGNALPRKLSWRQPLTYQVSFLLTLPGTGLQEPGQAFVDELHKQQRISYWNGMTTYVYNAQSNAAWSILPRVDKLQCFQEPYADLVPIFPTNLARFRFKHQAELSLQHPPSGLPQHKDTVTCDEWTFSSLDRADDGYYGTYSFWTTTLASGRVVPVRFAFEGHNVILGDAHYDKYTIDYYAFAALDEVDPFWVSGPPKGMPCRHSETAAAGGGGPAAKLQRAYLQLLRGEDDNDDEEDNEYSAFRRVHGSRHAPSDERRGLFLRTQRLVDAHNRHTDSTYELGINFMADWTPQERAQFASSSKTDDDPTPPPPPGATCRVDAYHKTDAAQTERAVDHVAAGLALPPGEQGTCGSGWAFAALGAVEGQIAKQYDEGQHPPVALSAQNVMDCAWPTTHQASSCKGGHASLAYEWMIEHNHGQVATLESYPWLNQDGFCHFDAKRELQADGAKAQDGVKGVAECYHVTAQFLGSSETRGSNLTNDELVEYFNYKLGRIGPLAVSIDTTPEDFHFYKSGVYSNAQCKSGAGELNHVALAVGYNLDDPVPYTRVRNNWGRFWGEGGYARIAQRDNVCGVATAATYVLLDPKTRRPTSSVPSAIPTASPVTSPPPTNPPSETAPPTDPPTAPPTDPPTAPPTEPPTEPPTAPPTEPATVPPTEPPTNPPTETAPPTLPPTVPPTETAPPS